MTSDRNYSQNTTREWATVTTIVVDCRRGKEKKGNYYCGVLTIGRGKKYMDSSKVNRGNSGT